MIVLGKAGIITKAGSIRQIFETETRKHTEGIGLRVRLGEANPSCRHLQSLKGGRGELKSAHASVCNRPPARNHIDVDRKSGIEFKSLRTIVIRLRTVPTRVDPGLIHA